MKRLSILSLAVASLVASLVARSETTQPLLIPGRDVAVVYRLGGAAADQLPGGAPDGVRLQWDATRQRLRAEPIGRPVYAITDLGRRVADVVFTAQASYFEVGLRAGDPQSLLAGSDARFVQRGRSRVIGLECTDWEIHSRRIEGTGCVTNEGVVLRADGAFDGRPGSLVALSVTPGRQPDSAFQPPEGFFKLSFPNPKK